MASGTSSTQEQQEEDASELQFPKGSLFQYIKLKLNKKFSFDLMFLIIKVVFITGYILHFRTKEIRIDCTISQTNSFFPSLDHYSYEQIRICCIDKTGLQICYSEAFDNNRI